MLPAAGADQLLRDDSSLARPICDDRHRITKSKSLRAPRCVPGAAEIAADATVGYELHLLTGGHRNETPHELAARALTPKYAPRSVERASFRLEGRTYRDRVAVLDSRRKTSAFQDRSSKEHYTWTAGESRMPRDGGRWIIEAPCGFAGIAPSHDYTTGACHDVNVRDDFWGALSIQRHSKTVPTSHCLGAGRRRRILPQARLRYAWRGLTIVKSAGTRCLAPIP